MHQVVEALVQLTEQVFFRHLDVIEEQLCRVLALQSHFLEITAALETLHAALDDEQAQTMPGIGIGTGNDDDQVREDAV